MSSTPFRNSIHVCEFPFSPPHLVLLFSIFLYILKNIQRNSLQIEEICHSWRLTNTSGFHYIIPLQSNATSWSNWNAYSAIITQLNGAAGGRSFDEKETGRFRHIRTKLSENRRNLRASQGKSDKQAPAFTKRNQLPKSSRQVNNGVTEPRKSLP